MACCGRPNDICHSQKNTIPVWTLILPLQKGVRNNHTYFVYNYSSFK